MIPPVVGAPRRSTPSPFVDASGHRPPGWALEVEAPATTAADASLMSTANSDMLGALIRPPVEVRPSPAEALSDVLVEASRRRAGLNLVALAGADIGRMAARNRWRVGLATTGFLLGFVAAHGLLVQAGFNRLVPVSTRPFNTAGQDHRTQAAAMIGWAVAGGVACSILLSCALDGAGDRLQRWRGGARRAPPSPLADLLFTELGSLVADHRWTLAPAFALGLLGYLVPVSIATQAGFNYLRPIPSRPFNPGGVADRELAGVLFGWGLTMSVGGLCLGVVTGVALGRAGRRLWGRPS